MYCCAARGGGSGVSVPGLTAEAQVQKPLLHSSIRPVVDERSSSSSSSSIRQSPTQSATHALSSSPPSSSYHHHTPALLCVPTISNWFFL